jgi:hypothetical protein
MKASPPLMQRVPDVFGIVETRVPAADGSTVHFTVPSEAITHALG